MPYQKFYTKINWKNRPSTSTPLGATNLNHVDNAVDELDNRVVTLDASKFNISEANSLLKNLEIDTATGIIKATYYNESVRQWDLNLEKIPVSFSLSPEGILTMTTSDGTKFTANIASLIVDYQFLDGTEIDFTATSETGVKKVTAIIKNGSIKAEKLDPSIQADILNNRLLAETAAANSQTYSSDSKRYAVGGVIAADAQDNAKYYSEKSKEYSEAAEQSEGKAKTWETNARASQAASAISERDAGIAAAASEASKLAAGISATNAKASESVSQTNADSAVLASASAIQAALEADNSKKLSETNAQNSEKSAVLSQSAALEAQDWADKAEQIVDIHIATPTRAGIIMPDDITLKVLEDGTASVPVATKMAVGLVKSDEATTQVDANGVLSVKTAKQNTLGVVKGSSGISISQDGSIDVDTTFEQASQLANIIAGEAIAEVLGKVSKSIASIMGLEQNALLKNMLTNIDVNDGQKIPSAALSYLHAQRIGMSESLDIASSLTGAVNQLNSNLSGISFYHSPQYAQINFELNGEPYYEQHFPDGGIKLYDNNWSLKWETALKSDLSQKTQIAFYAIADVAGVSTGQVTGGYHNVSKMSNGQCRYSAHFTCYPGAIPNGNVVGYLPAAANPYQIVYDYVYDTVNKNWLHIRIGNSDGSIVLEGLDGAKVTASQVTLEFHIDF